MWLHYSFININNIEKDSRNHFPHFCLVIDPGPINAYLFIDFSVHTMYKVFSNIVSSTNLYFTGPLLWWATGEQIGYNRLFTFHKFFLKQNSQVTFNESRHPVIFYFAAPKTFYMHQLHMVFFFKCTFFWNLHKSFN